MHRYENIWKGGLSIIQKGGGARTGHYLKRGNKYAMHIGNRA